MQTRDIRPKPHASVLLAALAATATMLAACVPNLGPRPTLESPSDLATRQSFAAPAADWPADRWWETYDDPQLSALIEEALKGSPTLAQAEARLRSAAAQVEQARAATLPSAQFNGQVAMTEESRAQGFPTFIQQLLPQGYIPNGRLTLDATYDLDLFGKNRAALAAAVSEAAAVGADEAQARLTLSTAVAQAYGNLVQLTAEREAAVETVQDRTQSENLVAQRVSNGLDTQAELQQAKSLTPSSQAEVATLDEQILLTRHQIAALLGEGPDRGLSIVAPKPQAVKAFGLPPRLALDLVGRRPDIVAARLRAEAAAKRIDSARAAFYPDVVLNAYFGQQALPLAQILTAPASIGNFGPAVTLPIFEGGRLRGEYRGARADYDSAVDAYDETLVQALRDVADAATSVQSAQVELADRRQAFEAGEKAYTVAKLRYQGGLSEYVSVLTAEDTLILQRRALADAETRAFILDIALVRALGGGFNGA
jgi:NodT family efflux transporter outer membrane factor (OMF) lipoprotein